MDIKYYVKNLRNIAPEDKKINEENITHIFTLISLGASLKDILRSEMMMSSVISLVKMLYCNKLIALKSENIFWNKNVDFKGYLKNLNIISTEIKYQNSDITWNIFKNRYKNPNLNYYQSYNTYQSLIRRFNLMQQFGDTSEKSIVFLGDDELFSIFYALTAISYTRILVLDIDEELLQEIKLYSKKYNLNIETRKFDVFADKKIDNEFDIFFASGLKKLAGLLMFILTGVKFLHPDSNAGYFTYYPYVEHLTDIDKQQDKYNYNLQKSIQEYGFFLEHLSSCDEIDIGDALIKKVIDWIEKDDNLLLKNDKSFTGILSKDEALAADPLFPYFSIKPINIARIKRLNNNTEIIDNYLKMTRRFKKGQI